MNAIAFKKWWNKDWRNSSKAVYEIWLKGYRDGAENLEVSIQLWDGSTKKNYEATLVWELNHYNPRCGWIQAFTGREKRWLKYVGGYGKWHKARIEVDVRRLRYSTWWDGHLLAANLPMYVVHHPEWGRDISFWITAEVTNPYPGGKLGKGYFKNWKLTIS